MRQHTIIRTAGDLLRALIVGAGLAFLFMAIWTPAGLAAPVIYDEPFDDDFAAGRNIPDGVDAARSSAFAPINSCRPARSGKLMITSIDISSFTCPDVSRTSCCGPALGFEDGGGTYITFHYTAPFPIQPGSYVSFQVIGYGSDYGTLTKSTSTDGTDFSQISGSTGSSSMGNYIMPLPTGTTDVYFRLQIGNSSIFDGIIVDSFHAVLYDTPQPPTEVQEGGGSFCTFNAEPFCPPPAGPSVQFSAVTYSASEGDGSATIMVTRGGSLSGDVQVSYGTASGSATAGSDFAPTSGVLTFPSGDATPRTFQVPVLDDGLLESNETFQVILSNPTGGGGIGWPGSATVTIVDDEPTLQFSAAQYSVTENSGPATITVTRAKSTVGDVQVSYSTTSGSATAGADFTATSGTLTFPNGDSTPRTITVPILDDLVLEGNETLSLQLSSPTGGAFIGSPGSAEVTILDNETQPSFQLSAWDYLAVENAGTVTLTVTRSGVTFGDMQVSYSTAAGTATAGADFASTSGVLIFPSGDATPRTFTVPILDDGILESDETFEVILSDPTGGARIGSPGSATVIIRDDEPTLQFSAAQYSAAETSGLATITVTRARSTFGDVQVSYSTTSGSATAGVDFTSTSGTLAFPNGDSTPRTITVPILDDPVFEGSETFTLQLSNPTGGAFIGSPGSAQVTILDDETQPSFQFSSSTFSSMENSGVVTITVTRAGATIGDMQVSYGTASGTAEAGSDFVPTSGVLTFPGGDATAKTFTVGILDDDAFEGDETLQLNLSNPTGGAIVGSPGTALLAILDNEHGVRFSDAEYSIPEAAGNAVVTVTRAGPDTSYMEVSYSATSGSASAGSDFTPTSGVLIFPAGDSSPRTFLVPVLDDFLFEGEETAVLNLSDPVGGQILLSTATLRIADDETGRLPGNRPRILVHLQTPTSKNRCTRASAAPACESAVVQGQLYPQMYFAYILVAGANASDGLAGVQFGIEYGSAPTDGAGIDIFAWALCATMEFPTGAPPPPGWPPGAGDRRGDHHGRERGMTASSGGWPDSGGGNLITWDWTSVCQRYEPGGPGTGVVAITGYFYMTAYSPARLSITPRPVDGWAKTADCSAVETVVAGPDIGTANLGSAGFGDVPGCNPCQPVTGFPPPAHLECRPSGGFVRLSWDDVGGESGYYVFRNGSRIAELPANTVSYVDSVPPDTSYIYAVQSATPCERSALSTGSVSGVGDDHLNTPVALRVRLTANPTAAPAGIRLDLPKPRYVDVRILDLSGRLVQPVAADWFAAGSHLVRWDGRDTSGRKVSTGIYFVRAAVGSRTITQKLVLRR